MARKHVTIKVSESRWEAARKTLIQTKREGAKLDVDRIIAAAGELIVAYEIDDDVEFARALDMIVRYGYDSAG